MVQKYSAAEAAKAIGTGELEFRKGLKTGRYHYVIGDVETKGEAPNKRYYISEAQLQKLIEHFNDKDRLLLRVLSMGGGIQSTTLLLLHLEGTLNPAPDCTMFIDLGWESQQTYSNLRWLKQKAQAANFPFHWVKGPNIQDDIIKATARVRRVKSPPFFLLHKTSGKKTQITRDCTGHYKAERMAQELRELIHQPAPKNVSGKIHVMLGISTDEADRMNNFSRYTWIENKFPLIDMGMSREDCIAYIKSKGLEPPPKSACLGCPYRPNADWLDMKTNRPEEFAQVVYIDRLLKEGINNINEPLFIHQSLRPLDEVVLNRSTKAGWGNECSGMCAT